MAFRTLGGEKNAYQEYKTDQDHERRQREKERKRRRRFVPDTSFDPMATMAGGFPQDPTFYGSSGGSGGPFSSGGINSYGLSGSSSGDHFTSGGKTPFGPSSGPSDGGFGPRGINSYGPSLNLSGRQLTSRRRNSIGSPGLSGMPASRQGRSLSRPVSPLMSKRFTSSGPFHGPYISGALNPHGPTCSLLSESHGNYYPNGSGTGSLVSRRSRHSGSPAPQYSVSEASSERRSPRYPQDQRLIEGPRSSASSSARQSRASSPRGSQRPRPASPSRALILYRQRGDDYASMAGSRSGIIINAAQRIPSYQSPLGDMTRSYLEGMVPNSEADSFRRCYRREGR